MFHQALNNIGDINSITVTAPRSIGGTTLQVSNGAAIGSGSVLIYISIPRMGIVPPIFEVTFISGNTLTLTAGAVDGSTDINLLVGDPVQCRDNAGLFIELQNAITSANAAISTINGVLSTLRSAAFQNTSFFDLSGAASTAQAAAIASAASIYISALTGDGTASGPGSSAFTLATVASAGTHAKVTFNNKGLVTSGTNLVAGDIPDLSATYSVIAGNAAIVTVGTVASGTWNATTIAIAHGGTGQTTASTAINALLPAQAGQNGNLLGTDGTAAAWQAPPAAGITIGTTPVNGGTTGEVLLIGAGGVVSVTPNLTYNTSTTQISLNGSDSTDSGSVVISGDGIANSAWGSPAYLYIEQKDASSAAIIIHEKDAPTGSGFFIATTAEGEIGIGSLLGAGLSFDANGIVGLFMFESSGFIQVPNNPPAIAGQGAFIQGGNGSPQGVFAAAKGSLYLRRDGGAGTTLYVKESGAYTTNTGWVAASGGGITIGATAISGGTSGNLLYDAAGVAGAFGSWNGTTLAVGSGTENLFVGIGAGNASVSGSSATGIGWGALAANTSGPNNVAVGRQSLSILTSGGGNISVGASCLVTITTGNNNTAVGTACGLSLGDSDSSNTLIGYLADGFNGCLNSTAIGSQAKATQVHQVMLGTSSEYVMMPGSAVINTGASGTIGLKITGVASQTAPLIALQGISSTSTPRDVAYVDAILDVTTDASRLSSGIVDVVSYAGREYGLRICATGSGVNASWFDSAKPNFQGGVGIHYLPNATTAPTGSPSGGIYFYALAGGLVYQSTSGTLTFPTATDQLVGRATTDTLINKTVTGLVINTHMSPVATVSNSAGTTTCDASANESFQTTLSTSTTALLITNAVAGRTVKVKVIQAAAGGPYALTFSGTNTITWFTTGAGAPGVPQTASGAFYVILICTGTNAFDGYSLPFSSAT